MKRIWMLAILIAAVGCADDEPKVDGNNGNNGGNNGNNGADMASDAANNGNNGNNGADAANNGRDAANNGRDAANNGTDAGNNGTDAGNNGTDAGNNGTADMGPDAEPDMACAEGFRDLDGDGMCDATCAATGADAFDCGPGGTCVQFAGDAARYCDCALGYAGDMCEQCTPGYEDVGNGVCELNLPPSMNLNLWLDASDSASISLNGDSVFAWHDRRTGVDRELSQTAGTAMPTLLPAGRAGRDVVSFDGGDQLFMPSFFGLAVDDWELIIAFKPDVASTPNALFGATEGTSTTAWTILLDQHQNTDYRFTHRVPAGATGGDVIVADRTARLGAGWVAVTHQSSGALDTLAMWASDTPTEATAVTDVTPSTSLGSAMTIRLGRNQSGFFSGEIYEVLIYTRRLSVAERDEVKDYLNAKWQLF